MATPVIDIGLLDHFSPIFVFLFVLTVIYAVMQWAKIFGGSKIVHATIAIIMALFASVFSNPIRMAIELVLPWFTFLMIFGVIIIVIFKMFGVSDDSLKDAASSPAIIWTILIIVFIMVIIALGISLGNQQLEYTSGTTSSNQINSADQFLNPENFSGSTNTGDIKQNIGATFYHPRVLGVLFLLAIMAIGVRMLTSPPV